MTYPELSQIANIPIDTLKGLARGRPSSMSEEIQRKIALATGGIWDPKRSCWMIGTLYFNTGVRLTCEYFEQYHEGIVSKPGEQLQQLDQASVTLRINELFRRIPKRTWSKLVYHLNDVLEDLREEFAPNDRQLRTLFALTQPRAAFDFDESAQKIHGVRRGYPGEMAQLMGGEIKISSDPGVIGWAIPLRAAKRRPGDLIKT